MERANASKKIINMKRYIPSLFTCSIITACLNFISAAIAITFTSFFFSQSLFTRWLALASALSTSLLTITSIILTAGHRHSRTKLYQRPAIYIIPAVLFILAGAAAALQIATFVRMQHLSARYKTSGTGIQLMRLRDAGYVFGIAALLANIVVALALPTAKRRKFNCLSTPSSQVCERFPQSRDGSIEQVEKVPGTARNGRDQVPMEHTSSGLFIDISQPPPIARPTTADSAPPSLTGSGKYSSPPPARSQSSRSRYLLRRSTSRSRRISLDEQPSDLTRQSDGFDNWDTSTVDSHTRDTVMDAVTSDSPNVPLTSMTPPSSPPTSPVQSSQPHFKSMGSEIGISSPLSPPKFSAIPRQSMVTTDQSLVHPLFRTTSPTPPPSAMPGSVITAFPLNDEALPDSLRSITRLRSDSRPSPLRQVKSFDDSERTRTPTPPLREAAPPMPDCTMMAGFRTSPSSQDKKRGSRSMEASR